MSIKLIVDPDTAGVSVENANDTVSILWNDAVLQAVINEGTGPTIASRAYAITHTAIFEAWAAYDPVAIGTALLDGLQQDASEITEANKTEAMSYAAYVALLDLFPDQQAIFDALMDDFGYSTELVSIASPAALVGIQAGDAVLADFAGDGSNQENGYADTIGYTPVNPSPETVNDIASWTPEYVPTDSGTNLQNYLTPHWGDVQPFALDNAESLRPDAPEPFFNPIVDATLDFDARTITINGLSPDATRRDLALFQSSLLEALKDDVTPEVRHFLKNLRDFFHGRGEAPIPLTIDVSPTLIGPVINPDFIEQAEAIVEASANLTTDDKVVAEFWEDGGGTAFPPGTWMTFATAVSTRDEHDLNEDAQLFFMMANAVFDAGIATWDAKTFYDYSRPISVIRDLGELGLIGEWGVDHLGNEGYVIEAYAGAEFGTQTILAENFITYQNPLRDPSPPFAEYTSGHSSFSAAGAEILEAFTGSSEFDAYVEIDFLIFEGITGLNDPVHLEWETFDEAADEAGISRIYGGIHFEDGDLNGRLLGEQVGEAVYETASAYIDGTADDFLFL